MDKRNNFEVERISPLDSNYFFGFHDICSWNKEGNKHVVLKIDDISIPPDMNIPCEVGYLNEKGEFVGLSKTLTYNYPQGARQQWIGQTDNIIVNDRFGYGFGSKIIDCATKAELQQVPKPIHTIAENGIAFSLDYARLFRVGGYGYPGVEDKFMHIHAPKESGLDYYNIYTGESGQIISVAEVAAFKSESRHGKHHYITHVVLSPNQQRLAFLHRFKLADGGETTRLMTIGVKGDNLRCLATGFLSHFDWKDDNEIVIWGRTGSMAEKLRGSLIYKIVPSGLLKEAKKAAKKVLNKKTGQNANNQFSWNRIGDNEHSESAPFAKDLITRDGHPMLNPQNRDWMICDTYPDQKGERSLFLYQFSGNKRINLGLFKMLDKTPDLKLSEEFLNGTQEEIIKSVGIEKLAFTRSGYHCDLHPRWSPDGKMISFDSIHEGRRQVYAINVEDIVNFKG